MAHSKDVFQMVEMAGYSLKIEAIEKEIKRKGGTLKMQKLKWTGKPEQFAFIFLELAKKGFIEIPSTRGEASYAKFAKTCFDLFEFETETTLVNLERAMNPKKNELSEGNMGKFTIPYKDDIS